MPLRSFGPSGAQSENNFSDADKAKLDGIESGATADQTGAEIKVAYEAEANTNAFTDSEKTNIVLKNQENIFSVAQKIENGVYIGDTAAANLLDDYEEGTFTPTFQNIGTGTFSTQVGRYTKVGNLVTIFVGLSISSVGTASGSLVLTGLPFTSAEINTIPNVWTNLFTSNGDSIIGWQSASSTSITLYVQAASGGASAATHANMGTGNIYFYSHYYT